MLHVHFLQSVENRERERERQRERERERESVVGEKR